ncbi:lipopolysaccharide kinase InaA family protein [Immundisolibacter sp.]|uniref:lipopolysaccharide kinase InaA family protein n=1 Tax=Immundisolibacter sp. TaxID=1934948 RepID=UPI002B27079B|nr:lipopolysaccharide kinase InaA family protein [Immundisolibacter sp.]
MTKASRFESLPPWAPMLAAAGLDQFQAWWTLRLDEVEAGNRQRGGWSSVCRYQLAPDIGVFVKRQQDHVFRSAWHPLRGRLTAEREFRILLRCRAAGIPVAEPLLFATQPVDGHQRGVLVTRELAGYRPLDALTAQWQEAGWPQRRQRQRVLQAVAAVVRRLHAMHLEHNCLYPKHIMVNLDWLAQQGATLAAPVVLIDLEKCKWRLRRVDCARRDLDSLNRRSLGWSRADRRRFIGYYLAAGRHLQGPDARLWHRLARRG